MSSLPKRLPLPKGHEETLRFTARRHHGPMRVLQQELHTRRQRRPASKSMPRRCSFVSQLNDKANVLPNFSLVLTHASALLEEDAGDTNSISLDDCILVSTVLFPAPHQLGSQQQQRTPTYPHLTPSHPGGSQSSTTHAGRGIHYNSNLASSASSASITNL